MLGCWLKHFQEQFELALQHYMPLDETNRKQLENKLRRVDAVMAKLDPHYAAKLKKSFEKYERHVRSASHSVFQDFIFPIPIHGLSD